MAIPHAFGMTPQRIFRAKMRHFAAIPFNGDFLGSLHELKSAFLSDVVDEIVKATDGKPRRLGNSNIWEVFVVGTFNVLWTFAFRMDNEGRFVVRGGSRSPQRRSFMIPATTTAETARRLLAAMGPKDE